MIIKERPINFNTEMVTAILDNKKIQTRSPCKPQPYSTKIQLSEIDGQPVLLEGFKHKIPKSRAKEYQHYKCPYGKKGDQLWVRETFCLGSIAEGDSVDGWSEGSFISQCLDENELIPKEYCVRTGVFMGDKDDPVIWKPSTQMKREQSRIQLEITDVRVERVQEIEESGAIAEGMGSPITRDCKKPKFIDFWDSIYKEKGYGWDINPWVWVVSFRRV